MQARFFMPLALLLAAALLLSACDAGAKAVKNVGRVVDEAATLAAPKPPSVVENADAQAAVTTLNGLEIAARGSGIDYDRDDWRHWVDADRDCQNTRAEVLIAESRARVSFAPRDDGEDCRVTQGEWLGPWSGQVFTDAGDVDIDHHVPLGHAHEAGGWQWDADRKRAYANDLSHPASLQVTKKEVNRAKGKQPPDEWRPADKGSWCGYALDWIAVKANWQLTVTETEVDALQEMLATCSVK